MVVEKRAEEYLAVMKTLAEPSGPAIGSRLIVGATLAAMVPLVLALVWAFAALPGRLYEAKAVVGFYPGQPVNAEEGLRALWAFVPQDAGIGILVVPGRPHAYEISTSRSDSMQATERIESALAAMNSARRPDTSTFQLIERTEAPSLPTYPRRLFLLKDCSPLLLLPLWVGGILWAYQRRLQSSRARAVTPL